MQLKRLFAYLLAKAAITAPKRWINQQKYNSPFHQVIKKRLISRLLKSILEQDNTLKLNDAQH